jgi:hypothetical protein
VAQDRHAEKYQNDKFCARVPCGHSDYIACCSPPWVAWTFAMGSKKVSAKKYEAHHVLCWSCVIAAFFTDVAKPILAGTDWCVNRKPNMVALPLWGHTVKWYMFFDVPPGFANLPQHDWDHNCKMGYTFEVSERLKGFAMDLQAAKQAHELPEPKDIAAALDSTSDQYLVELRLRGARSGGTHKAFETGGSAADWYLPFSMAADAVATARRAPVSLEKMREAKRKAILAAQALLGE